MVIYFWLKRWNGSIELLAEKSKKPHSHPNQHTEEEIKMIRNFRWRNPQLGLTELCHRLRKKGYTRRPKSLYRVMKKLDLPPNKSKPPKRQPALWANDPPGRMCADWRKSRSAKMYSKPGNEAVSVYRHRRVYPHSLSVRLWGAKYILIGRFRRACRKMV